MLYTVSVDDYMIYNVSKILEINHACRGYCKLPYPNHPEGCPNFNKNPECPPKSQLIEDIFDMNKEMFFVVEEFDLKEHIVRMKLNHPWWTDLQLRNLLYWQGGVRKRLKEKTEQFMQHDMIYTLLPESMGVMVINTALKLVIPIERNPKEKVFKIALVGYPKTEQRNEESMFNF